MNRALIEAIARQDCEPCQPIDATEELLDLKRHALAVAKGRPLAVAVLAWCQGHTAEVGPHRALVEDLRVALATRDLTGPALLALFCEVPETAQVGLPGARKGLAHV